LFRQRDARPIPSVDTFRRLISKAARIDDAARSPESVCRNQNAAS
jgi:hypothetical protein